MNAIHPPVRYSVRKRHSYARRYPNAASSRQFWNRLADTLLCTVSCIGIVAILFFLITM